MKYNDLAEQLLKCCLALKKDNELQTKKIKAQAEVIETIDLIQLCSSYSEYAQDNQN